MRDPRLSPEALALRFGGLSDLKELPRTSDQRVFKGREGVTVRLSGVAQIVMKPEEINTELSYQYLEACRRKVEQEIRDEHRP